MDVDSVGIKAGADDVMRTFDPQDAGSWQDATPFFISLLIFLFLFFYVVLQFHGKHFSISSTEVALGKSVKILFK